MNIAFRVDASPQIGIGHAVRSLRLAGAAAAAGARTRLVCRHLPPALAAMVRAEGHELVMLEHAGPSATLTGYGRWLGTDQETDARASAAALADGAWDWIVVDHYALDATWERRVRAVASRILAIDDLADRAHDCDVLLDQNFYADGAGRYTALVPGTCAQLLGPRYALLGDGFTAARAHVAARSGPVRTILIAFGGIDADNHTERAMRAVAGCAGGDVAVDVVIGAGHPAADRIPDLARELGFRCHVQSDQLAPLMAAADLAIGAGGSMTWERCCLGVPSFVFALADNQRQLVRDGAEAGFLYAPEPAGDLTAFIGRHVQALMENEGLRRSLSRAGMAIVDGRGLARVARRIGLGGVSVRPAASADAEAVFLWRNAPAVRAVSHHTGEIDRDAHQRWFDAVLANPERPLLIGSRAGDDVGVVRFDIASNEAEVSIYLAPGSADRGLGGQLLAAAEAWLCAERPAVARIRASVRAGNTPSHHLFASAGYAPDSTIYFKALRTHD